VLFFLAKSFKVVFAMDIPVSEDSRSWTVVLLRYLRISSRVEKILSLTTDINGKVLAE